jgi:TonB family protein
VLLAAVLGLSAWKSSRAPINLDQKVIRATLVRRGQARDSRLLPRVEEPPPPPKVETPPAPIPPPPEPPKPVAAPVPSPAPAARPEAGKAPADDAQRRSRLFDAFQRTSQRARKEPLEGAADGDPEGTSATAEGEQYFGIINRDVHRYYDVSQTIPEQERLRLKTDIFLKISPTGAVVEVKVAGPSGNELFDNAVLAAVKKAAPFPAPPAHLRDALRTTGVVLRFTVQ